MKNLLFLLLFASCAAVDKVESSSNVLWYNTKALKVIDANGKHYLLESFSNPRRTYEYKSYDPMSIGDTLIMTDQIRSRIKIKKVIL